MVALIGWLRVRGNNAVFCVRRLHELKMVWPQHLVQQAIDFVDPLLISFCPLYMLLFPPTTSVIEMLTYVLTKSTCAHTKKQLKVKA